MSEPIPTEVVLWQQLGKHLKTEVEVSGPEAIQDLRYGAIKLIEVIRLKVRFSNTAPDAPDLPRIVFTGVGLSIVPLPGPPENWTSGLEWRSYNVKMEKPARRVQSRTAVGIFPPEAKPWEDLTADESAHGIALFPGDSATLELTIPVDDIRKSELHVQGSVSRRQFFHYDQIVKIPQA